MARHYCYVFASMRCQNVILLVLLLWLRGKMDLLE
jgi:hypothetical protein